MMHTSEAMIALLSNTEALMHDLDDIKSGLMSINSSMDETVTDMIASTDSTNLYEVLLLDRRLLKLKTKEKIYAKQ